MAKEIPLPKSALDLVGTKKLLSGGLFSGKRREPEALYDVIDIRVSDAYYLRGKQRYLAFELLVKNENMTRSRWTRPFPTEVKIPKNFD